MIIFENVKIGLDSIRSNPLRSALTLSGISIGIAAVLYVVILGEVTKSSINERLESLGSNVLMIRPGASRFRGVHTAQNVQNLTWDDSRSINENSTVVHTAVPVLTSSAGVEYRDQNWNGKVTGTTPGYLEVNNLKLTEGQFFTEKEVAARRRVCVLGATVQDELMSGESLLGKSVMINSKRFDVIGLLEAQGENWNSPDDQVYIPLTTAQSRLFGADHLSMILAQIGSSEQYDEALFDIETTLRQSHRLREDQDNDFRVRRQDFFLSTIQETNTELANFIILIALISLVVGGIGIANVMLVSVTERIREIGTRLAIGATRIIIMTQFLVEAMVLGSVGGLLGVMGGFALNYYLVGTELIIPWYWIGYSIVICISVGMIAGFYPAYQAAKMDVIEALRYE
ncbi:ABC transporter permease [bacterium]|nr:ABC transporter permease [bacterium]